MDMCFNKIRKDLIMPREQIHFPKADPTEFTKSFDEARCLVMQGGQGEVKHWAFNDIRCPVPGNIKMNRVNDFKKDSGFIPMSLMADHPNVQFNYFRETISVCDAETH